MANLVSTENVKTPSEIAAITIRETLSRLSGENSSSEESVTRHLEPENKVSIPETMATSKAAKILAEAATAEQETQTFIQTFTANPYDGAVAFHNVLKTFFGSTGRAVPIKTFFGEKKPQTIDIDIAYGKTLQVTWGRFEFALFEGHITLGVSEHPDYGDVFQIAIECPKKFAASVAGLKKLIEEELEKNSIYRGKAVRISGKDHPRFIDLQTDNSVVYNDDVMDRLDDSIWAPLRHTELLRDDPESKIDPRVLLFGPYGTGKSECGRLTARIAVDNGWTFISYDSGKGTQEDLRKALQTAKLFSPSVVFVEDIDIYAEAADSGHARSRLLEMFDGISSKGHEVLVVMTSNKAEKLDKGMMRPGRIDDMIEIGNLDRKASEILIRKVNGEQLDSKVDYDAVYAAVENFEPAFLRRTFVKARQRALVRNADELSSKGQFTPRAAHEFKLTTKDFVSAANIMAAQHGRHNDAKDEAKKLTINDMIEEAVANSLASRIQLNSEEIGDISVEVLEVGQRLEINAG